jgi:ADP-ribose pyrophosphatase YjhB (NUDIX family)
MERIGTRENPQSEPVKVRLTPAELTAAFGVEPGHGGRLGTVISVELDLARDRSALTEIANPAEKHSAIEMHLETGVRTHPDWLGVVSDEPVRALPLGEHLTHVRVFRLEAGKDYHDVIRGLCSVIDTPDFAAFPAPTWHFGVYAAVVDKIDGVAKMLTVRKNRGPYNGMLDLPGGSPEPGEDRDTTLAREIDEETGASLVRVGQWRTFDVRVDRASDGRPIQFRHHGQWREAELANVSAPTKDDEDVDGLYWLPLADWDDRTDLSAPLREVLTAVHEGDGLS